MYNLDINMASSLNVDGPTPRTPEIVNSLIAMTNPLDYNFGGEGVTRGFHPNAVNSDSNSSTASSFNGSTAECARVTATQPPAAISVQQTCSQLIKAGLKLTIEQKRKFNANDNEDLLDLDQVQIKRIKKNESESEEDRALNNNNVSGLTPEDEERRRRRRERNKIAATKCRLKKRERTANLMTESETLEAQNVDLKSQYQALKKQRKDLEEALARHQTSCKMSNKLTSNTTTTPQNEYANSRLPSMHSIESSSNHHSPYSDYLEYDERPLFQYKTTPSIVVESIDEEDGYQTCLADLDHPGKTYSYSSPLILQQNANQQCHQNYQTANASQNFGGINGCMA